MPKRILVVDDERQIVKLVEINLERAGYEVVTAYSGVEALEKVQSEKPDILVLNDRMPKMNGWEVLKKLQADPDTEAIPVIFLMEATQDADIFAAWQAGVSAYVPQSPLNARELLTFVQRIFESLESNPPSYEE